jgi:DNA repair exonuclease SbcCD ATPase subunit
MRDELDNVLETNKTYYDEWFEQEYDEFVKNISEANLSRIEDSKNFFLNFSNELQMGLTKFLDIPNSEFCRNLINIILKILNDHVFERLKKIGAFISEVQTNSQREINSTIDNLNSTIKRLQETINQDKKLNEERNKEKSELYISRLELETKYDKLQRDFKSREKEYGNSLAIEVQKYQKMEEYYLKQIKEKDNSINFLEQKIDKLNKEIDELNKEISNKTIELNKEITNKTIELERMKGQDRKVKSDGYDSKNVNLQSLFKTIQNIFMEFKESVDKLDREKENVFKTKYLELSTKEIEGKSRNWIDEIRQFREDQIRSISENYEKNLTKAKDELEQCNFELTKANYNLNEEIQLKETYKNKYEDAKKEISEISSISSYKDSIINTQKQVNILYLIIGIGYVRR